MRHGSMRERRRLWRKWARPLRPELCSNRRLRHLAARLKLLQHGLDHPEACRSLLELAKALETPTPSKAA